MSAAAQLALNLEPTDRVASAVAAWSPIESAPRDRAIEIGYWFAGRWRWLFHTAWNATKQPAGFYCDGEEIGPSHWRDISEPESADQQRQESA